MSDETTAMQNDADGGITNDEEAKGAEDDDSTVENESSSSAAIAGRTLRSAKKKRLHEDHEKNEPKMPAITEKPVKRSRKHNVEEEIVSTSAQRQQQEPTVVHLNSGTTAATAKGIGRVNLRLAHEQNQQQQQLTPEEATLSSKPQQHRNKLIHLNLTTTSTTTQITTENQQFQLQSETNRVSFETSTPTTNNTLPPPSPFHRLARSAAQLYATPLRPAVVAALEEPGSTTSPQQRRRLLAQGINVPDHNQYRRHPYVWTIFVLMIAILTVLTGPAIVVFKSSKKLIDVSPNEIAVGLGDESDVRLKESEVSTISAAEETKIKEAMKASVKENIVKENMKAAKKAQMEETRMNEELQAAKIAIIEEIRIKAEMEAAKKAKVEEARINEEMKAAEKLKIEETRIKEEMEDAIKAKVEESQRLEAAEKAKIEEEIAAAEKANSEATRIKEEMEAARKAEIKEKAAEKAKIIAEMKLAEVKIKETRIKEEMEAAKKAETEETYDAVADAVEVSAVATSGKSTTVEEKWIVDDKLLVEKVRIAAYSNEKNGNETDCTNAEEDGLSTAEIAVSKGAGKSVARPPLDATIGRYKLYYETIAEELRSIQQSIVDKNIDLNQWDEALQLAEEALQKIELSSSKDNLLQAQITLEKLAEVTQIPLVKMVIFEEINLPESLLSDRAVNGSATIASDKYILHKDLASLKTEMTGWAKMHAENLTKDDNFQIYVKRKIREVIHTFKRKKSQKTAVIHVEQHQATPSYLGLSRAKAQSLIEKKLRKQAADRTGVIDYAAIRQGASIIHSQTSPSYVDTLPVFNRALHLLGLRFYGHPPETALSVTFPANSIGQCWAFSGSISSSSLQADTLLSKEDDGKLATLAIKLAQPLKVSSVVIEHPPKSSASNANSAVKNFRIYGYESYNAESFALFLGEFTYEVGKASLQEFIIPSGIAKGLPKLLSIKLAIDSNWGHNYSCLYRFRVHGEKYNAT